MSLVILIVIGSILGSTSLIGAASKNGFLNGGLTRGVAGGTASVASSSFLVGYTNLDSFINAAYMEVWDSLVMYSSAVWLLCF